jgi:hypothetical protein
VGTGMVLVVGVAGVCRGWSRDIHRRLHRLPLMGQHGNRAMKNQRQYSSEHDRCRSPIQTRAFSKPSHVLMVCH